MPELDNEKTESSLVSTELTRDPVGETEELLGLEQLSLTDADKLENSKYLASVTLFGNQMMLELMKNRLSLGEKPKRGDPDSFTVIMDYLNLITQKYDESVKKENFPTRYGNMLVNYSDLIKACTLYAENRDGKMHISSSERMIEKTRLQQVAQISQIAQREMMIIRQRSGILAKSENGMTWKELFQEEGQLEMQKLSKKQEPEGIAVPITETGQSDIEDAVESEEESTETPTTIQGLQKELKLLQEKCESIQKALDGLMNSKTDSTETTEVPVTGLTTEEVSNPDTVIQ